MSLSELSGDVIEYVFIEDRLLEALRMKWWWDAKMSNLEYYIANINPQSPIQGKKRQNLSNCISLTPWAFTLKENPMEDEYHLIACSTYKAIHEKYDGLLSVHDNVNVICKFPLRRVSTYVHASFSHQEFLLKSRNPLS